MPTFGVAGRMLKRPHSINDERQEAGRRLVFSPQTNKTSNDPTAQMFGGLIQSRQVSDLRNLFLSERGFKNFPLNWINIPNRSSLHREAGLKKRRCKKWNVSQLGGLVNLMN